MSVSSGLGVAMVDQEESGYQGGGAVEAEDAERGPWLEGVRLMVHGDGRFAGVHREVLADGVLPGLRQQRYEDRGDEEHAEEGRDRAGAAADDRAEAEAEQSEYGKVQAGSG